MHTSALLPDRLTRLELAFIRMRRLWEAPALRRRFGERLGAHIDPSLARTLHAVSQTKGDIAVRDAAAWLCVDASTASRMVDAAVTSGYLERRRSDDDRRRWVVTLTKSGADMLDRVRFARHEILAELVADWPDDDIEQFADMMERLAERVAEMEDHS